MDMLEGTVELPDGAWTPKVRELVRFIGYKDSVVGEYQLNEFLVVTFVYGPDSEWFGGVQVESLRTGIADLVWTWEIAQVLTPEYLTELTSGNA